MGRGETGGEQGRRGGPGWCWILGLIDAENRGLAPNMLRHYPPDLETCLRRPWRWDTHPWRKTQDFIAL